MLVVFVDKRLQPKESFWLRRNRYKKIFGEDPRRFVLSETEAYRDSRPTWLQLRPRARNVA